MNSKVVYTQPYYSWMLKFLETHTLMKLYFNFLVAKIATRGFLHLPMLGLLGIGWVKRVAGWVGRVRLTSIFSHEFIFKKKKMYLSFGK